MELPLATRSIAPDISGIAPNALGSAEWLISCHSQVVFGWGELSLTGFPRERPNPPPMVSAADPVPYAPRSI